MRPKLADLATMRVCDAPPIVTERPATRDAGITPRGLSRTQAAAYVGVSPSTFDKLVADGIMPASKQLRGRVVWDRFQLDERFDALDDAEDANPWD